MARQTSTGTGGGAIKKWAEMPMIEGVYLGTRQGQQGYTPLASIRTASGVFDMPAPFKLRELLTPVKPGVGYVWIQHTGKIALKGGKTMNTFELDYDNEYAADPQSAAPAPAPVAAPPATPAATGDRIADLRAKLEARIGVDGTAACLKAIGDKHGMNLDAIAREFAEFAALNGIK